MDIRFQRRIEAGLKEVEALALLVKLVSEAVDSLSRRIDTLEQERRPRGNRQRPVDSGN